MKKHRKSACVFSVLLALILSIPGSVFAQAQASTQGGKAILTEAEVEAKLTRLLELCEKNLHAEVLAEFENENMAAWLGAFKDKGVGTNKVVEMLNFRASSLVEQKKYVLATKDYLSLLELSPSNADTWAALGGIYLRLSEHNKAVEAYNKAYDCASRTGKSLKELPINVTLEAVSILMFPTRDYAGALKTLERYTYDDIPKMKKSLGCKIYRAYGRVYVALGREEEALAGYKAALELEAKPD